MLIGAMNPCPCGYFGDPYRRCTCSSSTVTRYQQRISGPFLDRVDIFVEVPHIDYEKLSGDGESESSAVVRQRVSASRERQQERFRDTGLNCNAEMTAAAVRQYCGIEDEAQQLLRSATQKLYLSARAFHRVLKLARTIADLEATEIIKTAHLAEALQYRPRHLL